MAITLDGTNGINSSGVIVAPDGSAAAPAITNDADTNTGIFFPAADTIAFAEGGAEAMRIDSSGRVGIGTTAPAAPLEVLANSSNALSLRVRANASNFGVLRFASNDGNTVYSQFDSRSDGFLVTNVANIPMVFATNDTERARITSGGEFLVGTTSANGKLTVSTAASDTVISTIANTSASPYGLLTDFTSDPNNATNYGYKFRLTNNTNIFTIFSNGTTSARSDERFKKDVETTRDGYADDLAKLRVVKYRWYNAEENSPKELGFIAQEVEKVFPGLVSTELNDDGIDVKSIKNSVFIPMLVKAIQELKAINDAQASRIETLEAKVATLEANNV